jgi:hypothetical protein
MLSVANPTTAILTTALLNKIFSRGSKFCCLTSPLLLNFV